MNSMTQGCSTKVGRWLGALWVLALALYSALGCSTPSKQAGGLMVVLATDMQTPSAFDTVHVDVLQLAAGGQWATAPLHRRFYVIPAEMTLPTTISLAAGSSPYQTVQITVTGHQGGKDGQIVVQRVVETQVPTDRLAELTIFLGSVCAGKIDCPVGDSCQPMSVGGVAAGSCGSNLVDVATLPAYAGDDWQKLGVRSTLDGGDVVSVNAGASDGSVAKADAGDSTVGKADASDVSVAQADAGDGAGQHADASDNRFGICSSGGWCWSNPLPQGGTLLGVWSNSSKDIWAVGQAGTILHWDGGGWSVVASGTQSTLSGLWGSGANDIWAVGEGGTILHWKRHHLVARGERHHVESPWCVGQ